MCAARRTLAPAGRQRAVPAIFGIFSGLLASNFKRERQPLLGWRNWFERLDDGPWGTLVQKFAEHFERLSWPLRCNNDRPIGDIPDHTAKLQSLCLLPGPVAEADSLNASSYAPGKGFCVRRVHVSRETGRRLSVS